MIKAQLIPAFLVTIVLTVLCGLGFPILVGMLGQAFFPHQANGSLIVRDGRVVGSELIGQAFHSEQYFHGRPSAAGAGYDALASGGTNLGPTSRKLILGNADDPATPDTDESYNGITDLALEYRRENGLDPEVPLPADAVTHSGSGLDPHISPRNAELQLLRVARARKLAPEEVRRIVRDHTVNRFLGIFGDPGVNVLAVNLELDRLAQR